MKIAKILSLFMLVALAPLFAQQQKIYVVKGTRLFDSTSGRMVEPGVVIVADGKVKSIGGSVPNGATVIDLGDASLLPGFIDAHTHLTYDFDPDYNGAQLRSLQRTIPEQAIRAAENARKTLMAGFTTVRDVGSGDFLDVGLRDSINAGI